MVGSYFKGKTKKHPLYTCASVMTIFGIKGILDWDVSAKRVRRKEPNNQGSIKYSKNFKKAGKLFIITIVNFIILAISAQFIYDSQDKVLLLIFGGIPIFGGGICGLLAIAFFFIGIVQWVGD